MENVKALVDKLQQQLQQSADSTSLLATVQQIQDLLSTKENVVPAASTVRPQSSKVAVVMPFAAQTRQIQPPVSEPVKIGPAPVEQVEELPKEKVAEHAITTDWLHNLMQEIPTLAHQKEIRELNEVMSAQNGASLNDKLKQSSIEVAEVITQQPVRDLKKAIGVNDRFVFVNELFRGDEVMYERSIKTINSFNVLQEAEFWMERELKLKLGWDDSKDIVRHFLQLVRRRFASM